MKLSWKVGNGPVNKWLNFGGDPDHRLDTGLISAFVTIGRYGKWLTDDSFILFRQMAALVRRAFAEACSVPVLLVIYTTGTSIYILKQGNRGHQTSPRFAIGCHCIRRQSQTATA